MARITLPETVAALTRRERGGHIAHAHTVTALKDFQHDFIHQYRVVDISASLIEHAARLARTHALRGCDAVQLAAALEVQAAIFGITLISADGDLNAAALAEGLTVDNPNEHP